MRRLLGRLRSAWHHARVPRMTDDWILSMEDNGRWIIHSETVALVRALGGEP